MFGEILPVVLPIIVKGIGGVFGVIIMIWLSIALLAKVLK